jgi:hypothetical protein
LNGTQAIAADDGARHLHDRTIVRYKMRAKARIQTYDDCASNQAREPMRVIPDSTMQKHAA